MTENIRTKYLKTASKESSTDNKTLLSVDGGGDISLVHMPSKKFKNDRMHALVLYKDQVDDMLKFIGCSLSMVWVVFRNDSEGSDVVAICSSYERAEEAKTRLAAILSTSLHQFEISEVAFNCGHPFGLKMIDSTFDV